MSGSLTIEVHPLVVMNIADHMTRSKYRTKGVPRVIGAILGKQEGRVLEICNTVETKYVGKQTLQGMSDEITIDEDFMQTRITAYKTMFPDLDCLGWYSVDGKSGKDEKCDQPSKNDVEILQNVVSKFAENPLMLIMNENSQSAKDKKKIPFFLYELAVKTADGKAPASPFVQLDYTLASEDSE